MPHTAYIVECVRTAGGKKNGRLREMHPIAMGAAVLDAIVERTGIDGALIDDVIVGCVAQSGAQGGNIGRNMVLASRHLPESVPGTSVDRQCGSSQQAIHFAAQAVMSGTQDCVIAAGVEHMSSVPIGSNIVDGMKAGHGFPSTCSCRCSNSGCSLLLLQLLLLLTPAPTVTDELELKYGEALAERGESFFSQFEGAEMLAEQYDIQRGEMEAFAELSHARAVAATDSGRFAREIVALQGVDKVGNAVEHRVDEGIRPGTTAVKLAKLKTLKGMKRDDPTQGRLTAALSSQICDGAAAILICNEAGLRKLKVRPRAKIVALALAGADPVVMLGAPIPATRNVLARAGMSIGDMDLYEVNEAFASVPLAWRKALGADMEKLNVNGGAMALGHPLGGTGCKLMTTLVHELERRGGRFGLQAICEGGGTANATIIERVDPQARL